MERVYHIIQLDLLMSQKPCATKINISKATKQKYIYSSTQNERANDNALMKIPERKKET